MTLMSLLNYLGDGLGLPPMLAVVLFAVFLGVAALREGTRRRRDGSSLRR